MFSAATPVKKVHTRASAAARRSQSRAASVYSHPVQADAATTYRPGTAAGPIGRKGAAQAGNIASVDKDATLEDPETQGVLLRTETHSVYLFGSGLPTEVQQILGQSGASIYICRCDELEKC